MCVCVCVCVSVCACVHLVESSPKNTQGTGDRLTHVSALSHACDGNYQQHFCKTQLALEGQARAGGEAERGINRDLASTGKNKALLWQPAQPESQECLARSTSD